MFFYHYRVLKTQNKDLSNILKNIFLKSKKDATTFQNLWILNKNLDKKKPAKTAGFKFKGRIYHDIVWWSLYRQHCVFCQVFFIKILVFFFKKIYHHHNKVTYMLKTKMSFLKHLIKEGKYEKISAFYVSYVSFFTFISFVSFVFFDSFALSTCHV